MVVEENDEEEEIKTQKQVTHDVTLAHIDGRSQYLTEQDDANQNVV